MLIYGNTPVCELGEYVEKFLYLCAIGLVFSIPFTLYCLAKSAPFWYRRKHYLGKLRTLEQKISGKRDIMASVNSNKNNLKIDKVAEHLNYIDYEKYLRKIYG